MELYGYEFIRESDLAHHGIKGQKWGVRRFQNEDGSLTSAGKNRYAGGEAGGKQLSRSEKRSIRKEYRVAQRARNKELNEINESYDRKKAENAFGFDSGKFTDRVKGHLKNEYERQQAINRWDQKNLDAKRQYRIDMGKKKTDTLLMKWQQESIDDISKQTQGEFNKEYIKNLASRALNAAYSASQNASYGGASDTAGSAVHRRAAIRKGLKK